MLAKPSLSLPNRNLKSSEYEVARQKLMKHPLILNGNMTTPNVPLEDVINFLSKESYCKGLPVIFSMAAVGSDLYWQLIENFIFSMVRFDLIHCSMMVCVSDSHCMDLCRQSNFPCYDYQYGVVFPVSSKLIVFRCFMLLKLNGALCLAVKTVKM